MAVRVRVWGIDELAACRGLSRARRHEDRLLWAGNPGLFALLEMARHIGPIQRVPRLGWVVGDPVLARRVLNDHGAFSMTGEGGVGHLWTQLFGPRMARFFGGSDHTGLRTYVRDLFTETAAETLVENAQGPYLSALRAWLGTGETVDLADTTRVLAGRTVSRLLGLPFAAEPTDDTYRTAFAAGERLAALALGTATSTDVTPGTVARARVIVEELTPGLDEAYRDAPDDTILGRCREMGLGVELSRGLVTLLAVAGTETGASATGRTAALLHDTGQMRRLLAEPGLMPGAVREGLRVSTPAAVIGRHVTRDTELEGRLLRGGDRVIIATHVADNAVGPFDITREYVPETRQLWFGAGRHLCLGSAVARIQLTRMLETLIADGRPWQVVERRPARKVLVPAYAVLRVRLEPAGRR